MTRTLAALAPLWLAVGASGRAEAGSIYTYTFTTDEPFNGVTISGSFQVDSSHIGASGNTDISDFITGLSFTGPELTFNRPPRPPRKRDGHPHGRSHGGGQLPPIRRT